MTDGDNLLARAYYPCPRCQRPWHEGACLEERLAAAEAALNEEPVAERVHACPPKGGDHFPCCGGSPFGLPKERMTLHRRLVTCGTAAEARLAAAEAVLRRARHYFPVNRTDAMRWEYDDDEDRDDLIAMRRDIDAVLSTAEVVEQRA